MPSSLVPSLPPGSAPQAKEYHPAQVTCLRLQRGCGTRHPAFLTGSHGSHIGPFLAGAPTSGQWHLPLSFLFWAMQWLRAKEHPPIPRAQQGGDRGHMLWCSGQGLISRMELRERQWRSWGLILPTALQAKMTYCLPSQGPGSQPSLPISCHLV